MGNLRRRLKETLRAGALRTAYQETFSTPSGRRVLADLCARGSFLRSTFAIDGAEMAFAEGQRALVLTIIGMLRWTDGEVLALAAEHTAEMLKDMQGDEE